MKIREVTVLQANNYKIALKQMSCLNVQRNSKPYWFILKHFLSNKKVYIIPPFSPFYEN